MLPGVITCSCTMCASKKAPGLAQALLYRSMPRAHPDAWHGVGVGVDVTWLQKKRKKRHRILATVKAR